MKKYHADRATLYSMNYVRALKSFEKTNDRKHLCQAIYYGIKSFARQKDVKPFIACDSQFIFDDLSVKYENMNHIISFMQRLTPNELLKLFPVKKFYGGEKIGIKDYFYTMDTLKHHGLDTPIGNQVYSILCDYTNIEISLFLTKLFSVISQLDIMRRATRREPQK